MDSDNMKTCIWVRIPFYLLDQNRKYILVEELHIKRGLLIYLLNLKKKNTTINTTRSGKVREIDNTPAYLIS